MGPVADLNSSGGIRETSNGWGFELNPLPPGTGNKPHRVGHARLGTPRRTGGPHRTRRSSSDVPGHVVGTHAHRRSDSQASASSAVSAARLTGFESGRCKHAPCHHERTGDLASGRTTASDTLLTPT